LAHVQIYIGEKKLIAEVSATPEILGDNFSYLQAQIQMISPSNPGDQRPLRSFISFLRAELVMVGLDSLECDNMPNRLNKRGLVACAVASFQR
jgi:hypothetical protein